jgi:hypothetical protein
MIPKDTFEPIVCKITEEKERMEKCILCCCEEDHLLDLSFEALEKINDDFYQAYQIKCYESGK